MIGSMWSLETTRGQRVPIRTLPALVGSERTADLVLPHPSIAAAHARLLPNGGDGLRVDALDGAALLVGGRAVERASLRAGDEFVLGRVRFTLRQDSSPDAARAQAPAAPAPGPTGPRPARVARSAVASGGAARAAAPSTGTARAPAPRGTLLRSDFDQLAPLARALLVLLLLLLAALLVYGVQALVVALA